MAKKKPDPAGQAAPSGAAPFARQEVVASLMALMRPERRITLKHHLAGRVQSAFILAFDRTLMGERFTLAALKQATHEALSSAVLEAKLLLEETSLAFEPRPEPAPEPEPKPVPGPTPEPAPEPEVYAG